MSGPASAASGEVQLRAKVRRLALKLDRGMKDYAFGLREDLPGSKTAERLRASLSELSGRGVSNCDDLNHAHQVLARHDRLAIRQGWEHIAPDGPFPEAWLCVLEDAVRSRRSV
jgi:hypothetical protein